jgi:RNA polymerase sigma-70 factor (ECF subfamily)
MNASHARTSLADAADDDLMAMMRAGEADQAFAVLERRHGREVRRLVQGIVRDPSLAADVATEALEKIWLERMRYQPGTNFRAWLTGVARNHALTALRALRRAVRVGGAAWGSSEDLVAQAAQAAPEPNPGAEEAELTTALNHAVADLPEHYRTVFELCVQQHEPYAKVSRTLHLPKGTIAIRIRRARQRLLGSLAHRLERGHVRALANHYASCA